MTAFKKQICITIISLFAIFEAKAQVCTGALGDPVINIDFGSGLNNFGQPIGETNYTYVSGTPDDGEYTVVKSSADLNTGWHQNILNHTLNDPDGYFMLVNASFTKGIFYQTNIQNLCPNTTYEFSAWVINVLRNSGIKPNIKFTIENNNVPIKEFSTGDILEGTARDWLKYGTIFTTPANVGVITLKMTNENPGGSGNDLAIDDITFRACGPLIKTSISETNSITANLCIGSNKSYVLNAEVSAGYNDPVFQWQNYVNNEWVNIPNETNTQTTIIFKNATERIYRYRLTAAERQNANSINCKVSSSTIMFKVNAIPDPIATNDGPSCFGADIKLFTNNVIFDDPSDVITYDWEGPNFHSNVKDPTIINMSYLNSGTYTLTVTKNGCASTSTTEVVVLPRIVLSTNIIEATLCEGESLQLEAFGGNDLENQYIWSPSTGLSNDKISNPIATPNKTTVYNVKVGRGNCFSSATITITVLEKSLADAGRDKKILTGQSTILEGKVKGDRVSYSWSPVDYLDDPTKLNPIATPPFDISYKLTAQSDCNINTDEVAIKVFQKIEIPNTFSPNGDGINDGWIIPAIEGFENIKLKVVNRLGQLVYETYDTKKSWDGKSQGKDLPIGTYYYTLYLNDNYKIYSGWVLLTR